MSSIKGTNEQSLVRGIISEEMLLLCELQKNQKTHKRKNSERKKVGMCGSTLSLTDLPSFHFLMIVFSMWVSQKFVCATFLL